MLKSVYYVLFLQLSMEQQVVLFVSLLCSITNGYLLICVLQTSFRPIFINSSMISMVLIAQESS